MATAGEIKAKLTLDNAQFKRGMQEAQTQMQQTSKSSKNTSDGMSALGKASAVAGIAIVASVGASVKAAANFEQSMAKVKAISGATDSEFKQLENTAKHLGATTQFSASQAAEGLSFLSLAGFKAQDSIDAIPSVLNLAAAGAIDLGSAADIASNIMTGFGLSAQDTGHATDVLAKTFTTANTDMGQLGMAMKYVAPVANALGWGIEDAATAIAKMSDAGIQGSQAGTSLRAALLSLANPTGQTAKAFDKLGISVIDANGEFKPLPELIGHISSKMEGMTDAQKTVTAAQLVGTEASAGFLALLAQGQPALQTYKTSLEESGGTAERIAKIQQETLIGAWTQVKSAAEGLAIQLGEALLPAFTALAQGASSLVSALSSVDPTLLAFGVTAITTTAGVAGLALGIGKIITAVGALGALIMANPITAGIVAATVGVGLLTAAVVTSKKETEQYKDVSLDTYKQLGEQAKNLNDLANAHDEMRSKIKLSNEELLRYKDLQNEIKKAEEGETKQQMIAEYEQLGQKAGVTKDEMNKYLQVNDDIIAKAPATATAFDSKGNAIVKTAYEARKLADEYRNMQREELILQQSQLMKNQAKDLENYTKSLVKVREVKGQLPKLQAEYNEAQSESERLQRAYNSALEESGGKQTAKVKLAEQQLAKQNEITNAARAEYREAQSATQEFNAQSAAISAKAAQYDKITQAIIEEQMAAVGVQGAIQEAIPLIQEQLNSHLSNKQALEQQKEAANGLSQEQQQSLDNSNQMINKLQDAKGAIEQAKGQQEMFKDGIKVTTDQAKDLNEELEKDVDKTLNLDADKAKQDANQLHKEVEKDATKKTKGDNSHANAEIDKTDKRAKQENTKKTKGDNSHANAEIDKTDQKAKQENTKKLKGNNSDANAKIDETDRKGKEEVTKPLQMDDRQAKARLDEIKREATKSETKNIFLNIKESITRTVNSIFGNAEKRHNGGTVHQVTKRPKFHNGGSPRGLVANRPKFDEVDVRLLKNEMVLTQAQQAGLFNLLRTANRPSTANTFSQRKGSDNQGGNVYHSTIQVAELHVREEADVEKVAAELKQMERSRERAMGR